MKRTAIMLVLLASVLSAGTVRGDTGTPVKVVGERVNLRARPDFNAEVVGQIVRGQIVTAKSFQDEWVEVAAPNSVDVWVHKDFVANNRVSADRLYVRGGPGINWQSVGQMMRDEPIFVRGEFGEWLKIAPPPNCSLWVSRKYVEVLQPEKPAPPKPSEEATTSTLARRSAEPPRAVKPPLSPPAREVDGTPKETIASPVVPSVVATASADVAAPLPPDLKLIPLEGQGRRVQREGVLRLAGFVIGRPSRYRLARQEGTRIETICYVRGNNAQLASLLGRRVLIRGREYWVRGVKDSVLIPDEIIPYAKP